MVNFTIFYKMKFDVENLMILTHLDTLFEWIAHIIIWTTANRIVIDNLTSSSSCELIKQN